MGKHDKRELEPSSIEFYKAEADKQRKRAEFAEDLVRQLREQIGRINRLMNEIEANAQDALNEERAETEKWKAKCLGLVEDYV